MAQLCGAGLGLLLQSSAIAIVADVVVPLGLWILTGAVPGLRVVGFNAAGVLRLLRGAASCSVR